MALYHIVMLKLKPSVSPALLTRFKELAQAMVGSVPGLQRIDLNPPHQSTVHRAQGYDMGLVAVLDGPEVLPVYAAHPSHLTVNELRLEISADALVYDLEFTP